jgi:hypothetical protein
MGMGLQNGRARPDNLAPLAPCVARSADLVQSAVLGREIRRARQGALRWRDVGKKLGLNRGSVKSRIDVPSNVILGETRC